jgi:hypothetical protein
MAVGDPETDGELAETPRVRRFRQRLDRHKEHLTNRDLDAARREIRGEIFVRRDGGSANHVGEVRDSQQGLRNLIRDIRGVQSDVTSGRMPSPAETETLNQILAEASHLLDYSREFVS